MATDNSPTFTEIELLHGYLGARLNNGGRNEPVDKVLADFAEYRRQLEELRASLREAEAQCDRGEARPLDLDALFARVDKRLEEEGIPE
jgi:hypothetical protein